MKTTIMDVLHQLQHILSRFASPADVETILNEAEHRNVPYYGYGIKSYILSCLETAVIAHKWPADQQGDQQNPRPGQIHGRR